MHLVYDHVWLNGRMSLDYSSASAQIKCGAETLLIGFVMCDKPLAVLVPARVFVSRDAVCARVNVCHHADRGGCLCTLLGRIGRSLAANPEQKQRHAQDTQFISLARHPHSRARNQEQRRRTGDVRLPSRRTTTGVGELKTVVLVIMFLTAHV